MRLPWVARSTLDEAAHTNALLDMANDRLWTDLRAERERIGPLMLRLLDLATPAPIPPVSTPEKPLPDEVSAVLDELGLYGTQRVREEAIARRLLAQVGATAQDVAAMIRVGGQPAEVGS